MPCPYFEPQTVASHSAVRLPLLDEYRGVCHAAADPAPSPDDLRLRCCNHGYSEGSCPRFPANGKRSSTRFHVVGTSAETIDVLYVEEVDYAPVRWYEVHFHPSTETLDPPASDVCAAAQIAAFGRSFARRFGLK